MMKLHVVASLAAYALLRDRCCLHWLRTSGLPPGGDDPAGLDLLDQAPQTGASATALICSATANLEWWQRSVHGERRGNYPGRCSDIR